MVTLNVGGVIFRNVSKKLLSKSPMLEALVKRWDNLSADRDKNRFLVLERNPVIFKLVIDYLNKIDPKFESDTEMNLFDSELDYFCLNY